MANKYLKIVEKNLKENVSVYDTMKEANDSAEKQWGSLSARDMVWTTIKVVKVSDKDVEKDSKGNPIWKKYKRYFQPASEELFDTDLFM